MVRTNFVIAVIGFVFLSAFTTSPESIVGTWKAREMENSTIEIYEGEDGVVYGKIIDSDQKPWIGEIILKKAKYHSEDKAWKGKLYSLKRDMTVDVTLSLESESKLKIVGKKFFMTKTFYWEK